MRVLNNIRLIVFVAIVIIASLIEVNKDYQKFKKREVKSSHIKKQVDHSIAEKSGEQGIN